MESRALGRQELVPMSHPPYKGFACLVSAGKLKNCSGGALLLLALELLILFPSTRALGQASGASAERAAPRRHARTSVDDRVQRLATTLDLNETQQTAVKNILEWRQQQTLHIRRDPAISGNSRIEQFRALQENTVERIRAVLNDEQRKKYDPLASRKIQSTPQPSVEEWLKATTPH